MPYNARFSKLCIQGMNDRMLFCVKDNLPAADQLCLERNICNDRRICELWFVQSHAPPVLESASARIRLEIVMLCSSEGSSSKRSASPIEVPGTPGR